jgi:hypothetical protein
VFTDLKEAALFIDRLNGLIWRDEMRPRLVVGGADGPEP